VNPSGARLEVVQDRAQGQWDAGLVGVRRSRSKSIVCTFGPTPWQIQLKGETIVEKRRSSKKTGTRLAQP